LILKGENKNAFYLLARKRWTYGGNVISKDEEISMCGDFYATGQCIHIYRTIDVMLDGFCSTCYARGRHC